MRAYRLYFLDSRNHILSVEILNAGADAQAVEMAERIARRRSFELWERDRLVGRLIHEAAERSSAALAPEAGESSESGFSFGFTCLDAAD